jgi:hypothetical protein
MHTQAIAAGTLVLPARVCSESSARLWPTAAGAAHAHRISRPLRTGKASLGGGFCCVQPRAMSPQSEFAMTVVTALQSTRASQASLQSVGHRLGLITATPENATCGMLLMAYALESDVTEHELAAGQLPSSLRSLTREEASEPSLSADPDLQRLVSDRGASLGARTASDY